MICIGVLAQVLVAPTMPGLSSRPPGVVEGVAVALQTAVLVATASLKSMRFARLKVSQIAEVISLQVPQLMMLLALRTSHQTSKCAASS